MVPDISVFYSSYIIVICRTFFNPSRPRAEDTLNDADDNLRGLHMMIHKVDSFLCIIGNFHVVCTSSIISYVIFFSRKNKYYKPFIGPAVLSFINLLKLNLLKENFLKVNKTRNLYYLSSYTILLLFLFFVLTFQV